MTGKPARPKAVAVIGVAMWCGAAIAVVVGTTLISPSRLADWLWELNKPAARILRPLGAPFGVTLIALGIGLCPAAAAFWRGRRWAWWLAVAVFALNGCGDVISYFVLRDLLRSVAGIAVACVALYFLIRPNVRRFFAAGY